jgi:hypothetical protein
LDGGRFLDLEEVKSLSRLHRGKVQTVVAKSLSPPTTRSIRVASAKIAPISQKIYDVPSDGNSSYHALCALSFFDEFPDSVREIARILREEIRVLRFCSKVPDDAGASENIVLAAFACVHIQLRCTRPEVSTFTAQAEVPEDPDIES